MNPQENIARVNSLVTQIRGHPMCGRYESDKGMIRVIFPNGDFPVHGVQCSIRIGKICALEKVLAKIESIWIESIPR